MNDTKTNVKKNKKTANHTTNNKKKNKQRRTTIQRRLVYFSLAWGGLASKGLSHTPTGSSDLTPFH
eukprot:2493596-Pyramimonas_sp.AAC.1